MKRRSKSENTTNLTQPFDTVSLINKHPDKFR